MQSQIWFLIGMVYGGPVVVGFVVAIGIGVRLDCGGG